MCEVHSVSERRGVTVAQGKLHIVGEGAERVNFRVVVRRVFVEQPAHVSDRLRGAATHSRVSDDQGKGFGDVDCGGNAPLKPHRRRG